MASDQKPGLSREIELKLALPTINPTADPAGLVQQLARLPALARRKPQRRQVHNIYYDTPGQHLRAQRMALRIRRVGGPEAAQWLQTLKTDDGGDSALSQRGEWERPVPGSALDLQALQAAPSWQRFDPDGAVFAALQPCFTTAFERTAWTVRQRGGSVIEVALDIGQIEADGRSAPICEIELELLAGDSAALFDLARQIAAQLALLPLAASKAQRGYALLQGTLYAPQRARPPALPPGLPLPAVAFAVLTEMFGQFSANLHALCHADAPELVHQARVGWRRLRSAQRMFGPGLAQPALPARAELAPLLDGLGALRDLDVACTQTLPTLQEAYAAGDPQRAQAWQAMEQAFAQAAARQRAAVCLALQQPQVGAALLDMLQWLQALAGPEGWGAPNAPLHAPRRWVRRRMERLYAQWQEACATAEQSGHIEDLHHARILAKRLRYSIEALRPLLPGRAQRWLAQATRLQEGIGVQRDFVQAGVLAQGLPEVERGLVEFLRGVAVGRAMAAQEGAEPGG